MRFRLKMLMVPIAVVALTLPVGLISPAMGFSLRNESESKMSKDDFFFESVDVNDRRAVLQWADELCRELSLEDAASALRVEANEEAVIKKLTGFLPLSTRGEAARVCSELLRR